MENYKSLLLQQQEALTKDDKETDAKIQEKELELEKLKESRSAILKELRLIEKRLEKLGK